MYFASDHGAVKAMEFADYIDYMMKPMTSPIITGKKCIFLAPENGRNHQYVVCSVQQCVFIEASKRDLPPLSRNKGHLNYRGVCRSYSLHLPKWVTLYNMVHKIMRSY